VNILRLQRNAFYFSITFGVWIVLINKSNFGRARLQVIKPDMTHVYLAEILLVSNIRLMLFSFLFWLVLPFRERKNFVRVS